MIYRKLDIQLPDSICQEIIDFGLHQGFIEFDSKYTSQFYYVDCEVELSNLNNFLLDNIFDTIISNKITLLKPGGYLKPHYDSIRHNDLGVYKIYCNLNLSNMTFLIKKEKIIMNKGEIFILNTRYNKHATVNTTEFDRYVLLGYGKFKENMIQ